MTATESESEHPDVRRQPVYWFTLLELAVERGDHAAAADAQRELARLGIEVRYGRRRFKQKPRRVAHAAR